MTAIYHRRFYPDDVDGTVPYVAPISFGAPDLRYPTTFGGFLGMGEKYHPLPWQTLTYDTELRGYVVNVSRDQLEGAPSYLAEDEPDWNDPDYGRTVRDYYGYPMI